MTDLQREARFTSFVAGPASCSRVPDGSASARVVELRDGRRGFRLAGEIDLATIDVLATALSVYAAPDDDLHVDLGQLRFIDVTATRMLVDAARRLDPPARVVLHDPPRVLRRILDLVWSRDRTITIA
jgi:anti-anti-sigma regulatory factor